MYVCNEIQSFIPPSNSFLPLTLPIVPHNLIPTPCLNTPLSTVSIVHTQVVWDMILPSQKLYTTNDSSVRSKACRFLTLSRPKF